MYSPVGVVVFGRDGEVVELKAEVPLPGDSVKRIERLGERAERASLTLQVTDDVVSCVEIQGGKQGWLGNIGEP